MAIIDGNRIKAELLGHYLTHRWDCEVVAYSCSTTAAFRGLPQCRPEFIFAAVPTADIGVAELVTGLRRFAPAANLILLTARCDDYLLHTLGPLRYEGLVLEMEDGLTSLDHLLEQIHAGRRFVSPGLKRYRATLRRATDACTKLLTPREMEMLSCIAHSLCDEEIASHLGISARTALSHRQRIMQKLGIHTTPKLIQFCFEKGFGAAPLPVRATALASS